MLPAWASVTLGLGGVALGVFGGLAGVWLTNRHSDKQRSIDKLDERRERGAEAVGPVRVLLSDAHPNAYIHEAGSPSWDPGLKKRFQSLEDRWETARDRMITYTAGHPSDEVVELGSDVIDAVSALLVLVGRGLTLSEEQMALSEEQRRTSSGLGNYRPNTIKVHQHAVELCDRLSRLVREEPEDEGSRAEGRAREADGRARRSI